MKSLYLAVIALVILVPLRGQVIELVASGTITSVSNLDQDLVGTSFTVSFAIDSSVVPQTDSLGTQYFTAPSVYSDGATVTSFGGNTFNETASLLRILSDSEFTGQDDAYGFQTTGLAQGFYQSGIDLISTNSVVTTSGALNNLRVIPLSSFDVDNEFSFFNYDPSQPNGESKVYGTVTSYSVVQIPEPLSSCSIAIGLCFIYFATKAANVVNNTNSMRKL